MSLKSILSGKSERDIKIQTVLRDIIPGKKDFSTVSGREPFSSSYEMAAPYNLSNSYYASIVVTAFDFMARFIIAQTIVTNKEAVTELRTASNGFLILHHYCDEKTFRAIKIKLDKSIVLIKHFVYESNEKFTKLLPYTSFLARLEHIYRTGMPPNDLNVLLNHEETEILKDLKRVFVERFIPTQVTLKSEILFNPHFGKASISCGGADADIYIDGTLYDFKTSKQRGYKWQDIAQIYGYSALHCISNRAQDNSSTLYGRTIKKVALYKARFGEIEYVGIDILMQENLNDAAEVIENLLLPQKTVVSIEPIKMSETARQPMSSRVERRAVLNKKESIFKKLLTWINVKS